MPLSTGTRLGPYEVLSAIGAGGMGEVYRARDTKLNRDVAIKVLLSSVANDPERLARFSREAQVLASLNHPNIAHIHGFEDSTGVPALVMELVEGPTLADRIDRGPIPIEEALPIAKQIAEALEAAHEQGIIHRDLKPANIKIKDDGVVKVLDFGLAKALEPADASRPGGARELTQSPTMTTPAMMTGVGTILGTAAYMSPEQAKGRPADKRSDIWAFGCVLFEMLTGRRAFEGNDVAEVLASVLARQPDFAALAAHATPAISQLVARCLEKDRKQRIPDISVALFLFSERPDVESVAVTSTRGSTWSLVFAAIGGLAVIAIGAMAYLMRSPTSIRPARFLVPAPDKVEYVTYGRPGTSVAISPDGSRLAFTARDASGRIQLWLRQIDSLVAQPVPGTDGAALPFWSPDGRSIAYFTSDKLMRIDIQGGVSQAICSVARLPRGGAWNRDGVIIFGAVGSSLSRVSARGGDPTPLPAPAGAPDNRFPSFLPDGSHFLFSGGGTGGGTAGSVYLGSLDGAQPTRLIGNTSTGAVATPDGYVLFAREATLFAQRLDLKTFELRGEPEFVTDHLETGVFSGVLAFSTSADGVLAYGTGTARSGLLQLVWVDRHGRTLGTVGAAGDYNGVDLSPDGKVLAVHRHEGTSERSGGDIWLLDLARGTTSRFTFNASVDNASPVWSPDGRRLAFAAGRRLLVKPVDGASEEQLLLDGGETGPGVQRVGGSPLPKSWSPDGGTIVYAIPSTETKLDLWLLLTTGKNSPTAFARSSFNENFGQVSPDGRWIAYQSDENGPPQVFVRPFPAGPGKWQVSTTQGGYPRWRRDGKEIFYFDSLSGGNVVAVDINARGAAFDAGVPPVLFESGFALAPHQSTYQPYAVSADGQRFLIPRPPALLRDDAASAPIVVVQNWAAALKR